MEQFTEFAANLDSLVWSMPLVILCLGAGLYLSIRMGFPQVRMFGDMIKLLAGKEERNDGEGDGITPFQAFATTVGARVGMGNIAGIASAIFFGGPGSIFWMWIIALIGAASALTESILGQAYKIKDATGTFVGGPAYYIERGLKNKPFACLFAVVAFMGPGLLLPGVQINSLTLVFEEAFSVSRVAVGLLCCALLAFVVWGSIKRIARLAELLAPLMCMIYIVLAVIILGLHVTEIPAALALIVKSAFGFHPLFGAIIGSTISWGVKRGIYSNEAGMGCGAIVSAAAKCSHPAKQGLIQACSIYADTLVVGTATALIVILTGTFDVVSSDGVTYLLSQTGGIENGIKWTQYALINTYGVWAGKLLAIIIVLFVFTSMTGYCYQAESNVSYLFKGNKTAINVARIVFIGASFVGAVVDADAIWSLGDVGYGLMGWVNIIAILLLAPKASRILKDYERQRKEGLNPTFDPVQFGIEDETGAWSNEGEQLVGAYREENGLLVVTASSSTKLK